MIDRYTVQRNTDTYHYDIIDNVVGDRLFCSFTTEARAKEVAAAKNGTTDAAKLCSFNTIKYSGPKRNVDSDSYRFPKMELEVKDGMVFLRYE